MPARLKTITNFMGPGPGWIGICFDVMLVNCACHQSIEYGTQQKQLAGSALAPVGWLAHSIGPCSRWLHSSSQGASDWLWGCWLDKRKSSCCYVKYGLTCWLMFLFLASLLFSFFIQTNNQVHLTRGPIRLTGAEGGRKCSHFAINNKHTAEEEETYTSSVKLEVQPSHFVCIHKFTSIVFNKRALSIISLSLSTYYICVSRSVLTIIDSSASILPRQTK
jgi:hypothetical protein